MRSSGTGRRAAIVIASFASIALGTALFRLAALDFDLRFMIPERVYDVSVLQIVEGHGEDILLRTHLPSTDERQQVLEESNKSADLRLTFGLEHGNRLATWRGEQIEGERLLTYAYRVRARGVRYEIAPELLIEVGSGEEVAPTKFIQSDAPEIVELSKELLPSDRTVASFARSAFDRVQGLEHQPFKGTTDALTALRLRAASCNGRSRLLAALFRAQGIPARLVGGIILEPGTKRTSHQWIEAKIGPHWVPFDATNHHFAELPDNYLALYRGDHALFKHTSDVGYRYLFRIDPEMVPRHELEQHKHALGLWAVFDQLGIPLDLLKIIIMIPLGAMVVVIFRNVLGLRTYGTFLPVLIAAAAHNTGLWWGLAGFLLMIAFASTVRRLLGRLNLLHSPQLAVMLTAVIGALLVTALLGARYGFDDLAHVSLFPVAILAITSERFVLVEMEEGRRAAWTTLLRTMVVITFAYVTINSLALQILMLGFPELLLLVIATDIWLGRWMGLRLTEWIRFQQLLGPKEASA